MIHGTALSFGPTTTKFFSESSVTSGCVALNAATARQSEPGSRSVGSYLKFMSQINGPRSCGAES